MSASHDSWAAVILAAGRGKRMRSSLPKVLHPLAGWPMVRHVRQAVRDTDIARCCAVVAAGAADVRAALDDDTEFAEQVEPLGTGHAVAQARSTVVGAEHLLVLNGDVPLITPETLRRLMDEHLEREADLTLLSALVNDPCEYGRVQRDAAQRVSDVVEAADHEGASNGPTEINAGQYCFRASWLWSHIDQVARSTNGEFYLTSLVRIAAREGASVHALTIADAREVRGINDRSELAEAELLLRSRINKRHMINGVTIVDPATAYIDAGVVIGQDTTIEPNTRLRGATTVGDACSVGPDSDVRDSQVGDRCRIVSSTIEESVIDDAAEVGPYSHLRPGVHLGSRVHIGNFAELKNARLGADVKMGHHSYIGDAVVGEGTNVGAGTITCNFDGSEKHRTTIGSHVFIGSDTMLVAPITLGDRSRTGAGSVVTKDVPPGAVAIGAPARITQRSGGEKEQE